MHADKLNISEHFYTIQGEGAHTGVPSYFIRLQSCDLGCWWCDTSYASYAPEKGLGNILISDLIDAAFATNTVDIAFTGGEPTIQEKGLRSITDQIRARAKAEQRFIRITLETHGNHFLEDLEVDLVSMSPKLLSSIRPPEGVPLPKGWSEAIAVKHEAKRLNIQSVAFWAQYCFDTGKELQLKFVICSPDDLRETDELYLQILQYSHSRYTSNNAFRSFLNRSFMLMPEGLTPDALGVNILSLVEACKERGWRFSDRLHVRIWSSAKRGV